MKHIKPFENLNEGTYINLQNDAQAIDAIDMVIDDLSDIKHLSTSDKKERLKNVKTTLDEIIKYYK
jgi:hypothetical protein